MYVLAGLAGLSILAKVVSGGWDDWDSSHNGGHGRHRDPYGGKTLAPSNVTVITGLFRQDDPDLDPNGYDMLKDSFGLIDKSPDRWKKFTECV